MKKTRNTASIVIGGTDYSKYLTLPLVFQDTGVEELDSAIVELKGMREGAQFRPFLEVSLFGGKYNYVLADDTVTEVYGRGVYNHEITLIEPTKLMERVLMEAKSFTQPIFREIGEPMPAEVHQITDQKWQLLDWLDSASTTIDKNGFKSPYIVPQTEIEPQLPPYSMPIFSPKHLMDMFGVLDAFLGLTWTVNVYYSSGAVAFNEDDVAQELLLSLPIEREQATYFNIPKNELGYARTGVYTIQYKAINFLGSAETVYVIPISVYDKRAQTERATPYYIVDVLNIILETAHPLFGDDEPLYKLDLTDSQRERWSKMESPEFHFANGRTLYENLKEVGDFLHALPRVKIEGGVRKVYFQELGDRTIVNFDKGVQYGSVNQFGCADYANAVEANYENLINAVDEADGNVTDPYNGGFISLRSAQYRINEGESYIPTSFPIGSKIKKVVVNNVIGTDIAGTPVSEVLNGIDITLGVFEENEYNLLSSFTAPFPLSKTCALYYKTGQNNIEGLWYRSEDNPIDMLNALQRYAITNILNHFAKRDYPSYDYTNLIFQVTYIPFINGRARQERTEYLGGDRMVLSHNQGANQLSAEAFGENLRGKVAMLANSTETKMYVFKSLDDLPKAGQMYDSKQFISLVTTRVFPNFCISQITLTENYNSIGAFTQLKTGIRQYEIPAGQTRNTLIEEFCVVGKMETTDKNNLLCTDKLRAQTVYAFTENPPVGSLPYDDITVAWVRTYNDDVEDNIASSISLPVYSAAIGNSVYFGFSFADNFSAGTRSIDIGKSKARGTQDVQYGTPLYAKAKYLSFKMASSLSNLDTSVNTAHNFPLTESTAAPNEPHITTDVVGKLLLNKDGSDACQIAYQLHFCSNCGYIITSALAKMMPYVRSGDGNHKTKKCKAYFYNAEFDELTAKTSGDLIAESAITVFSTTTTYALRIATMPSVAYKSFSIVSDDGDVLIAKNTSQADQQIYFNFKRKR